MLRFIPLIFCVLALTLGFSACCGDSSDAKSEKAKKVKSKEDARRGSSAANVRSREKEKENLLDRRANRRGGSGSSGSEDGGIFRYEPPDEATFAVLEAAVATGIDKSAGRVPKNPGTSFSRSSNSTLALWVSIRNQTKREQTIYVRWNREGEEKAKQDLNIGVTKAWKTWAYKKFRPGDTGQWTVEILDPEGDPMETIEFSVSE